MFKLKLNGVIAAITCLLINMTISAQDIITFKNGDEVQAVVLEVGINDIRYKKFENQEGPDYKINKSEVSIIKYENGSEDVFNDKSSNVPAENLKQSNQLYKKGLWQNSVWQDDKRIKPSQIKTLMSTNNEALLQYKGGRSLLVTGQIIGGIGGVMLGWDLGNRVSGEEGNAILLGVGAVGFSAGMIMIFSGLNKMNKSLELYNSRINNNVSYQINLGLTQTGIGLTMKL